MSTDPTPTSRAADRCEPCASHLHGRCQGHRVKCDCTCGEAADGGRLG